MKRAKMGLCISIAACSLILGGCGTSLHTLTLEEENLIVHYAAYAVAKHNIQQKDGMSGVYIPEEGEEVPSANIEDETDEVQTPDDGSGAGQIIQEMSVSLAEAMGHEKELFIVYGGGSVSDNYVEGSAYLLEPSKGNVFYIMTFSITNPTQTDVSVDHVTKSPVFVLNSGDVSVQAESTLLMSDLSTYYGTIAAGQTVEVKLLFEVPKDSAESITDPALQMIMDNQTKNIKF